MLCLRSPLPGNTFQTVLGHEDKGALVRCVWGQVVHRLYRYWNTDTAHRGTWVVPVFDESFCVCVYSRSRMWQHVGGWWLRGLQLAGHRGPEFVLTEMFAQLKHHLLRHIAEGCQQQSESMESMNGRCKYFQPVFVQEHGHFFCFFLGIEHLHCTI